MDSNHQVTPMKRVFQSIGHFRSDLNKSMALSFINKILDLMPPFLTAWLIDIVSGNTPNWVQGLGYNDAWSNAIFIVALTVVVFLLESFFEWLYKKGFLDFISDIKERITHENDTAYCLYAAFNNYYRLRTAGCGASDGSISERRFHLKNH